MTSHSVSFSICSVKNSMILEAMEEAKTIGDVSYKNESLVSFILVISILPSTF